MPYRLVGGMRFYERKEVKDVLAYLRLIHNPFDARQLAARDQRAAARHRPEDRAGAAALGGARRTSRPTRRCVRVAALRYDAARPAAPRQSPFGVARARAVRRVRRHRRADAPGPGRTAACWTCSTRCSNAAATRASCRTAPRRARSAGRTCRSCAPRRTSYDELAPENALAAFLEDVGAGPGRRPARRRRHAATRSR